MINSLTFRSYNCNCKDNNKIFGISPQGNIDNNFNTMYFDQEDVIKKGYLDYIMPQIYYGFENEVCPFNNCVEKWKQLILKNSPSNKMINFYVGLAAYKCGMQDDIFAKKGRGEWKNHSDVLKRQIEFLRTIKGCSGYTFFSYNSFFYPLDNVKKVIDDEKSKLLMLLN